MTASRVAQTAFGHLPDGRAIELTRLTNRHGTELGVIPYGGTIVFLRAADRDGVPDDVVLGFDALEPYLAKRFMNSLVGRYGNRIGGARFTLDGRTYALAANNGPNHLHGVVHGWDRVVWALEPFEREGAAGVRMRHVSPDGDEGYPGTVTADVTYTLTDANALVIDYRAQTDAPTIVNLTQHAYFNLAGARRADILGHDVAIAADAFTPVDATLIPTGEIAAVAGTPFDFREPVAIGARIDEPHPQLRNAGGYDHNFVIRRSAAGLVPAVRVRDPLSGRTLEVATTEPGVQFYTGNMLDGTLVGRGGRVYAPRTGFCLETQHYPDSPNHPAFPSVVLRPGETYRSQTVFTFTSGDLAI